MNCPVCGRPGATIRPSEIDVARYSLRAWVGCNGADGHAKYVHVTPGQVEESAKAHAVEKEAEPAPVQP